MRNFTFIDLLGLLKHTDFEDGMNNAAIDYVRIFLKKNYFVTISWLNIIYSENQNDQEILSALLRVIAMTIKKEDSNKLLPLVKAGLNEQNVNTQESAIIVIEQWRTKECLLALESTKFESRMIKEYADEVKKELIKELHDVIKDDR